MKRRNFKLVYMVPSGLDEIIKERIVRTFQTSLSIQQLKNNIFEVERAAGHFPLEFIDVGTDEV